LSLSSGNRCSDFSTIGPSLQHKLVKRKKILNGPGRTTEALQRFEAALRIDSKGSDLLGLEMKGLQLCQLGRKPEALEIFDQIEDMLTALLRAARSLDDRERFDNQLQRIRNSRYMATIYHESGENGNANNVLIPLVNGQNFTNSGSKVEHC
jgi:tetratricopeptide (TPR) repeat protein